MPHGLCGIVKAMIHDLADLEPLLRQYHPEKVLVGPLLNLWTNSDKFDTSIVPEKTIEQKNDSQAYGFRPLTDDEKKEFEDSLNDDGKKILRKLSEKPVTNVSSFYASKPSVLPSDRDRELVDEAARGLVTLDAMSAHAQPSTRDQAQATLDLPIHANLPLDRDSFTFAAVGLESSTETGASTETTGPALNSACARPAGGMPCQR